MSFPHNTIYERKSIFELLQVKVIFFRIASTNDKTGYLREITLKLSHFRDCLVIF